MPVIQEGLDVTGAQIMQPADEGAQKRRDAPSISLPQQDGDCITHIALDIGGSLIKLVYFQPDSPDANGSPAPGGRPGGKLHFVKFETAKIDQVIEFIEAKGLHCRASSNGPNNSGSGSTGGDDNDGSGTSGNGAGNDGSRPSSSKPAHAGIGGEPGSSNSDMGSGGNGSSDGSSGRLAGGGSDTGRLGRGGGGGSSGGGAGGRSVRIRATGGGSFKFAELFEERLGVVLERVDEMQCLVSGCNFLLRAIYHEAFSFEKGDGPNYVTPHSDSDVFPYLLVNIGSGVSMLKVSGDNSHKRVSGSNLGGGTFWGLCRLLTRVRTFEEMLELSKEGDNSKVDMLVGDIYGGRDYTSIGLSATTIASSFGKVISEDKDLEDYSPADIAMALCRMVSYNIGQLAYLNAKRYGLSRIFFGGFFIRGHPLSMDTISFAISYWSQGEMKAHFLRHEGYLGAVGAFLSVHPLADSTAPAAPAAAAPIMAVDAADREPGKVRARFVERFAADPDPDPDASSSAEGDGATERTASGEASWVERFMRLGTAATDIARSEHDRALAARAAGDGTPPPSPKVTGGSLTPRATSGSSERLQLHVGALQYQPGCEPFPLLADAARYQPNTLDMHASVSNDCPVNLYGEEREMDYWLGVLADQIPAVVEKAVASEGATSDAKRRAARFARCFGAHITRLQADPQAYGEVGLADLFELREECLREFRFRDIYRLDKERENAAALKVLPDLLRELDCLAPRERLTAIIQGALAANIFDWGARAIVELYHNGTILEIYRKAREQLSRRPWRVDHLDKLADRWMASTDEARLEPSGVAVSPWRRAILFVDNAGADVVLGMLPLARELLRMGAEVVLAANSLPAINDITAPELRRLLASAAACDPVLSSAWDGSHAQSQRAEPASPSSPPHLPPQQPKTQRRQQQQQQQQQSQRQTQQQWQPQAQQQLQQQQHQQQRKPEAQPLETSWQGRLSVVGTGQGGPCLDLRRVAAPLAAAAASADLVVIEGMGRAVHTNLETPFRCNALKLAMIKNSHVAEVLFGGAVFDCICLFEPAAPAPDSLATAGLSPPAADPVTLGKP